MKTTEKIQDALYSLVETAADLDNKWNRHAFLALVALFLIAMGSLMWLLAWIFAPDYPEPVRSSMTSNPEYRVETLFEHEGVRVYRFMDGGKPVYYTDSPGFAREGSGK